MEVQVISNTIQKFNGESYYLCGAYFQRKGKRLHREVWIYHNGEIPKGFHVHHVDGNIANNSIENLQLIEGSKHLSYHMRCENRKEQSRESVKKAIAKAPEWHHSKAGAEWHSKQSKQTWEHIPYKTVRCAWCGCEFQSRDVGHKGDRYCCEKHKASALRWRRKHEGKTNYPGRECGCV